MVSGWSDGDVRPRGYVESHGGHLSSPTWPRARLCHDFSRSSRAVPVFAFAGGGSVWDGRPRLRSRCGLACVRRTEVACSPDSKVNAVHWGAQAGAPTALPPHGPTYNLHNPLVQRMQSLGFAQSA